MAKRRYSFSDAFVANPALVHPMSPRDVERYVIALVDDRKMPLALWLAETMLDRANDVGNNRRWDTWHGMWLVLLAYVPTERRLACETTMQAKFRHERETESRAAPGACRNP